MASYVHAIVAKSIVTICGARGSYRTLAFYVVATSANRSIVRPQLTLMCAVVLLVDFIAQSQRVLGSEIIFLNAMILIF